MQARRLKRAGERPAAPVSDPLAALPEDDRRNWIDLAEAVTELRTQWHRAENTAQQLAALMGEWERYGQVLARDTQHRNSMRRALVVEARVLLDKLWVEADGD